MIMMQLYLLFLVHNIQIASNLLIFNVSLNVLFYIVPKSFPMVNIWNNWVQYLFVCLYSTFSCVVLHRFGISGDTAIVESFCLYARKTAQLCGANLVNFV